MQTLSKFSRYHNTPLVIDDEDNARFIEWKAPFYGEIPEFLYTVDARDIDRPDLISYRLFGTVELWWLVLHYNKITDPFTLEVGQKLKIPNVDVIKRGIESSASLPNSFTTLAVDQEDFTVRRLLRRRVLPFVRPPTTSTTSSETTTPFLFNFAFPVPEGLTGSAHFQIQIAISSDFTNLITSRMTQTSVTRWFYYDPASSNGAGGFKAFPSDGINGAAFASQTVYYKVVAEDLGDGTASEYFFRYRAWVNNIEGTWFVSPPLILS